MCDDIALQTFLGRVSVLGLQMQSLDACLALGAILPSHLRALVATYVDILRREELCDLLEHVVDESQNLVVASAENVVRDAPLLPYLVRTAGASKLGIGCKSRLHMSWQVNLRNDGDVAVGCILHDVAYLLLCVEAVVGYAVVLAYVMTDNGLLALGTNLGEQRIFLYLDAPSLVVGEMPMEAVDVVQGEHVDKLAY